MDFDRSLLSSQQMANERDRRPTGSWRHAQTVETMESVEATLTARAPALTVLYHPDLHRVGNRVRLPQLTVGKPTALSRLEPSFAAPGETEGRPLADARMSRRPVWFEPFGGGLRIVTEGTSTQVLADGVPVRGGVTITDEAIDDGVVLELSNRFVLLLHRVAAPQPCFPRGGLVGDNDSMERLRGDIVRVADVSVPVLLRGESGTGKELVARAIHDASPRRSGPCVSVNMGAITPTTAASELFGHRKGSFTGADRDHAGYFGRADGGTLFLDEIGETPPELQVMLLRVLETGEVQPVGASRPNRVDVRLIAATDANLEQATRDGGFRLPLLHRLSGYEITIPPLRDRMDDIPRLFVHFLRHELKATGELQRLDPPRKGANPWLAASLVARLVRLRWPGNVRQLRNVARQLVISSRGRDVVRVDPSVERLLTDNESQIQPRDRRARATPSGDVPRQPASDAPTPTTGPARKKPAALTEDELVAVLRTHGWRLGPTAAELQMSRTTLYALIERSTRIRKARDLGPGEINRELEATGGNVGLAAEHLEVSKRGLQLRMRELGLITG